MIFVHTDKIDVLRFNALILSPIFYSIDFYRIIPNNTNHFCSSAVEDELYIAAGKIFALSMIYGGPAPRCLAPHTTSTILGEERQLQIHDVSDLETRQWLERVNMTVLFWHEYNNTFKG